MQVLPGFRPAFDFFRPQLPPPKAPWEMLFLGNGAFLLPFPACAFGDSSWVGTDSMSILSNYTLPKTLWSTCSPQAPIHRKPLSSPSSLISQVAPCSLLEGLLCPGAAVSGVWPCPGCCFPDLILTMMRHSLLGLSHLPTLSY